MSSIIKERWYLCSHFDIIVNNIMILISFLKTLIENMIHVFVSVLLVCNRHKWSELLMELQSWDWLQMIATKCSYGRKSAARTKPYFDVTFFVFLSSCFGNLEVGYAKTVNIFWKYMSATLTTYLCFDHFSIGGLFNFPYLPQKIVELQSIICSLFLPVFVLFSNIIDMMSRATQCVWKAINGL